jgi:hypothetical protein
MISAPRLRATRARFIAWEPVLPLHQAGAKVDVGPKPTRRRPRSHHSSAKCCLTPKYVSDRVPRRSTRMTTAKGIRNTRASNWSRNKRLLCKQQRTIILFINGPRLKTDTETAPIVHQWAPAGASSDSLLTSLVLARWRRFRFWKMLQAQLSVTLTAPTAS